MFDTHKLSDKGFIEMRVYKHTMAKAIAEVTANMPESRDKSIFITKIEEGVFFGARAIASKEGNYSEIVRY